MLFDNPNSSNALKVRFLLTELGSGTNGAPSSLEPASTGRIPRPQPGRRHSGPQDGDLVVSESHAILLYLAGREGRDDLNPAAIRERVVVDEFLDRFPTSIVVTMIRVEWVDSPPLRSRSSRDPRR